MRIIKICFYIFTVSLLFIAATKRSVHIFMAGDSTMANKPLYNHVVDSITGESAPEAFPERGWGQLLPEFLTKDVRVVNYAQNGRSTKTFAKEGWWDKIMSELQKGDYVIIQFGHNDEKKDSPRYASPEDFKKNLEKFVDDVRSKGGIPILATSVVRRKFDENGKYVEQMGAYPDMTRAAAKDKNVQLIDMHQKTKAVLENMGEAKSASLFLHLPAGANRNFPNGVIDNTHANEKGARINAGLFVDEMDAVASDKSRQMAEGEEAKRIAAFAGLLQKNAKPYVSEVWVADLGNEKYQNPLLYADYSDPDVCRVGDDYYMTASSFNCTPGLPILHSKDMVNWRIVGHAISRMPGYASFGEGVNHGGNVWAPAIRYHNGKFYIYYGDPDLGIFMTKTKDPAGEWDPLVLVKEGKGFIDSCPFWDEDGQAYLVNAFAGSRAGMKSLLAVTRLTPDGTKAIGESKIVYDGLKIDETIEGPKFYKRNGYYYIFAPAGGVKTGWQTILRSKNIFGPYERKVVFDQGKTKINGPHQGAWVDTQTGEDWFYHFQDVYEYGRIVHLQPMVWKNDWPVIGEDKDGDGCGEPVLTYRKPNIGKTCPVETPVESDEFNANELGLQWQWHANPAEWWYFTNEAEGCLSLYSVPVSENYKSLWDVPNLLLQKPPAREFTATTKITFEPNQAIRAEHTERTGLVVMGRDYALLSFENTPSGFVLSQNECKNADRGDVEKTNASVTLKDPTVYLRVRVNDDGTSTFSYGIDGNEFKELGNQFKLREGQWIGAKVGLFCSRFVNNNAGGKVDIDWFRITK
jgi:beta-xylosidase/lysophospholipase L1-like esterase